MTPELLEELASNPNYKLLKRVPSELLQVESKAQKKFIATIIDLETMGMDAHSHEILEIGMLSFQFTNEEGIIGIYDSYNELNDPGKPIP